jgi:hypothetical protein
LPENFNQSCRATIFSLERQERGGSLFLLNRTTTAVICRWKHLFRYKVPICLHPLRIALAWQPPERIVMVPSRSFTRTLLGFSLGLTLGLTLTLTPSTSVPVQAKSVSSCAGPVASSVFYPEVHLRKLHLVRPDLIPYPIYFKIYC